MSNKKVHWMKKWWLRLLLLILIVLWMGVIFGFSADNGEESESVSNPIVIRIVQIIKPDFDTLSIAQQERFFYRVSFIVRKIGHFSEYAILGVLISCLILTFKKVKTFKHPIGVIVLTVGLMCMIYAISDELHQRFVAGRDARIVDILIDTGGSVAGVLFVMIVWWWLKRKNQIPPLKERIEQ